MIRIAYICLFLVSALCAGCQRKAKPDDIEVLKRHGNEIIVAIHTYQGRHGYYPVELKDLDMDIDTDYGEWDYEGHRKNFFLVVGNHKKYGFMLSWNPNKREWEVFRSR